MVINKYSIDITLNTDSVDLTERWTMAAILAAMQTAADGHALLLGANKDQIAPRGFYWVVARTRIDMARYPRYGDTVTVTTWPGAPDRVSFLRYFRFEDAGGAPLGSATMRYILLDSATHAPVSPAKVSIYPEGFEIYPDINPQPDKIRFTAATRPAVLRAPAYSDIDLNRHMNNTRYAQWVCDLFPTARFERGALKRLQINYIADGVEGHGIALEVSESSAPDGHDSFMVRGSDTDNGGKTVFEAAGEWMSTAQ